ncbi:antibiotic biosynthesis monooxygenase [Caballeronia mineralivorans PML1(12)]|uniref:Antibiotic biosynthesis monooxygenase n=1 Tax=Caballeronia mineralivorans PML1(12) TaxID=908627 RepID=A0A0J1CWT9_9BURK|nr:antibiotic biosynthesis monooxygenase family protein [Caballeronia mineralivorans]KLU25054.1 antibiotic biosynthesis monooxygenase [Caballeronia mineralivorans PML1(12)]
MILELADLLTYPGQQAEFEQAVRRGVETVIAKARGFRHYSLRRSVESPERYILQIEWDSLEDHTLGFRGTLAAVEWRSIVDPYFACAPQVEHFDLVATSSD